MFLDTSLTDANRYGDICPVNIFPCDIYPYQEYLSCYWLNFDLTLKLDSKKKFNLLFLNLSFLDQNFFWHNFCLTQIFFGPTLLGLKFFGNGLFLDQTFFGTNFFLDKNNNNNNNNNHNLNGLWHNWN